MEVPSGSGSAKPHIALFPSIGVSHFMPAIEFAKRLCVSHGFSVTVITTKWKWSDKQERHAHNLASSGLDIRFTELPDVGFDESGDSQSLKIEARISLFMEKAAPHVGYVLQSLLNSSSPISALVIDFFCAPTLNVAAKLRIPTYVLFASSAWGLCLMLGFQKISLKKNHMSFEDRQDEDFWVEIPGLPLFPARDLPEAMKDRSDPAFRGFIHHCSCLVEATGILINTFQELEAEAVESLEQGKVLRASSSTNLNTTQTCGIESELAADQSKRPSIYAIGPLISESLETHECLKWLDQQPPCSVVFVSFGSQAIFSSKQITEIAHGLEASGHRFLWVVPEESNFTTTTNTNLESMSRLSTARAEHSHITIEQLLPKHYASRTNGRGLVVLNWAPQVSVLSHPSTGGFISHCGWNSTLESIFYGVPMIGWPLFAEQRLTRFMLVNHNKVAMDLKMDSDGFVGRAEVERAVRTLMEGEEGIRVRKNMSELKEKAKAACMEGGTSHRAMLSAAAHLMHKRGI